MKKIKLFLLTLLLFSCAAKKETGYVNVGKLRVYYERSGKGEPLLFLHAGFMDHTMWAKQTAFFESQNTVITIDLPGSGLTSGADTTTLVADVIKSVLDHLQVQKASVVGLSIGSAAAVDFVLNYPSRVNKLVLASPGANGMDKTVAVDSISLSNLRANLEAQDSKDIQKIATAFAATWGVGPVRQKNDMDSAVYNYVLNHALRTLQVHTKDSWANFQQAAVAGKRIGEINNKLLILYGDKDLPYIKSIADYMQRTVKDSKLVVFNGAAHMINMEMPDKFNKEVRNFLQ